MWIISWEFVGLNLFNLVLGYLLRDVRFSKLSRNQVFDLVS